METRSGRPVLKNIDPLLHARSAEGAVRDGPRRRDRGGRCQLHRRSRSAAASRSCCACPASACAGLRGGAVGAAAGRGGGAAGGLHAGQRRRRTATASALQREVIDALRGQRRGDARRAMRGDRALRLLRAGQRSAYAIVQTGELQPFANFLFKKGVIARRCGLMPCAPRAMPGAAAAARLQPGRHAPVQRARRAAGDPPARRAARRPRSRA